MSSQPICLTASTLPGRRGREGSSAWPGLRAPGPRGSQSPAADCERREQAARPASALRNRHRRPLPSASWSPRAPRRARRAERVQLCCSQLRQARAGSNPGLPSRPNHRQSRASLPGGISGVVTGEDALLAPLLGERFVLLAQARARRRGERAARPSVTAWCRTARNGHCISIARVRARERRTRFPGVRGLGPGFRPLSPGVVWRWECG